MPVDIQHRLYKTAMDWWIRCRDAYEGTDAVKMAGAKYLPLLGSHHKNKGSYEEYKLRALYFNATGRTVDGLSGAIAQKPPTIKLPKEREELIEDATLKGESLEELIKDVQKEVLKVGRVGVLVDWAADEGVRPFAVVYRAEDIVNWRTSKIKGDEVLTRVVLREAHEDVNPDDEFDIIQLTQYRVLELEGEIGRYEQVVWKRVKNAATGKEEWVPSETYAPMRRGKDLEFIPFVFVGPLGVTTDVKKPPILDLADVNLSHYRTMADLEHGRHFTALPTPWISGGMLQREGMDPSTLSIGSGVAWQLEATGRAGMLEFSGAGLQSLVTAEQDKRKMMAVLGARLLEDGGGPAETAFSVSMRHSGEHATLRSIAGSIEKAMTMVLRWLTWWVGPAVWPEDQKDVTIELNKEFFQAKMDATEMTGLMAMFQSGAISFETLYEQLEKGGRTREGVTAEEEKQAIEKATEESMIRSGLLDEDGKPINPNAAPPEDEEDDEDDDEV